MSNIKKNFYGVSLATLAFSLYSIPEALAQTCTVPPDCTTLGFTKTVADCSGHSILKCPFDQARVYCDSGTSSGSGSTTLSCPTGYFTYEALYPSCNETGKTEMIQYAYSYSDPVEYKDAKYKSCYKCKKCSSGFWLDPGYCGRESSDEAGCRACSKCTWSSDILVGGRCIGS